MNFRKTLNIFTRPNKNELFLYKAIFPFLCAASLFPHPTQGEPVSINFSNYELIFRDDFDSGLNSYSDGQGLWSTTGRRDDMMTNSTSSVFLSDAVTTSDGSAVGLDPLTVKDGMLHIGSGIIPEDKMDAVADALTSIGREGNIDAVEYYTGRISTHQTWAQAYGYYEMTAQIPEGKGHWPAFWLAPAGTGWPPEIDIFEAYGKGVGGTTTGSDNTFNVAVYFDAIDVNGNRTQSVDLANQYDLDANGNPSPATVRNNAGGEQHVFHTGTNALTEFGADIYSGMWTWAAEWTPDYIAFYFGKDRDSLVEIYRTPTPEDLTTPMFVVINDQIGSSWGWNPVTGLDHLTFAEDNAFKIDSVSVYSWKPTDGVAATGKGAVIIDSDASSQIIGSGGNDVIVTGGGQDFIDLRGGADIVHVTRGIGNTVIAGFGSDDHVVLEGFHFDGAADALARLTQVGNDVWLSNGAYPNDPQTIVFRDSQVADFREDQFVVRWSVTPDIWNSRKLDSTRLQDLDGDGLIEALPDGSRMTDTSAYKGTLTMRGSAFGDNYFLYRAGTIIEETPGGGVDTVYSQRSFTLPDHVENLSALPATQGAVLAGNAMDNRIESNQLGNILRGGAGNDLLISTLGNDTIAHAFGDGHDVVLGFDGGDRVLLEGYATNLTQVMGRLAQDGTNVVLDLGAGGSITFRDTTLGAFHESSFVITEGGQNQFGTSSPDKFARPGASSNQGGLDEALPQLPDLESPPLPPSGEIIHAPDSGALIRGGALDDRLYGGQGNDTLRGMDGDDWIESGAGSNHLNGGNGRDTLVASGNGDKLYGGAGEDLFIFDKGVRSALIMDFEIGDRIDLSRLVDSLAEIRLGAVGVWTRVEVVENGGWQEVGRVRHNDLDTVWDAIQIA